MATHSTFLPGKSHGQRSLAGSSPWVRKRVGGDLATKQQHNKLLVYSELCNSCHCLNPRTRLLSPQKKPYPLSRHPQPLAALIHFLCLGICLLWTFHTSGIIIQYVVLCNWRLSLNISRIFKVRLCCSLYVNSPFLFTAEQYCIVWMDHILFIHPSMYIWMVSPFLLL